MKITFRSLLSARVLGPLADLVHTGVTLRDLTHQSNDYKHGVGSTAFVGLNKNKGLWHITYRVWGSEKRSDPNGHLVKMRFLPDPETEDVNDLEVEVSCDCGAFVFWGAQYNVKQKNALERDIWWTNPKTKVKSLDQSAPTEPERNYIICKHINAAALRCASLIKRHLQKQKQDEELKNAPPEQPKAPVPTKKPAVPNDLAPDRQPQPKNNWANGQM